MGVKHTVLPDGQPPTVAFTVLAQLCGPKANETEMGAALFTKNGEGRNFDFDLTLDRQKASSSVKTLGLKPERPTRGKMFQPICQLPSRSSSTSQSYRYLMIVQRLAYVSHSSPPCSSIWPTLRSKLIENCILVCKSGLPSMTWSSLEMRLDNQQIDIPIIDTTHHVIIRSNHQCNNQASRSFNHLFGNNQRRQIPSFVDRVEDSKLLTRYSKT